MSKPKRKQIPKFDSEEQERSFWAEHDSADFVDWGSAQRRAFPNLRPTLRTISLRLPESMIGQLKVLANKRDIPYQSLLKQFLAERLQRELSKGA
jgi:predicted DNA binding CopG/RHH family protein